RYRLARQHQHQVGAGGRRHPADPADVDGRGGRSGGRAATESAAEFLESALIAIVLVFLVIRPFVVQAFYIPSGSMQPTLMVGDRILVNKFIYRIVKPNRGDVVVFVAPHLASTDEKDFIKRIVGLPGDTVQVVPTRA